MTDIPTTAQLAEDLDAVRSEVTLMRELAEAAHRVDTAPFESYDDEFETPPEFVAALPPRPTVPPAFRHQAQPFDQQALAAQGLDLLAQNVPDWNQYAERTLAAVQQNPQAFSRALGSGDPGAVAQTWAGAYQATKSSEATRAMKLAAQSAVGASGRPAAPSGDRAEWAAVVSAGKRGYWE